MRQTTQLWIPAQETKTSKHLAVKTVGVGAVGDTPSLTGEFVGEIHGVIEHTQNHPPGNGHQIHLWVEREVTEIRVRARQVALFPFRILPDIVPQGSKVGCPALVNT